MGRKKKAQSEIMGLAIVVVLVVFGMIAVLVFMLSNKPTSFKGNYITNELPINILGTLMHTTAQDCSNVDFRQLMKDCAETANIKCRVNSNEYNSCEYLETRLDMLNKTIYAILDQRGYKYYFRMFTGDLEQTDPQRTKIEINTACPAGKKPGIFTLPLKNGEQLRIWLEICK